MTERKITRYTCNKCGAEDSVEDSPWSPDGWQDHGVSQKESPMDSGVAHLCPACQMLFEQWLKVAPTGSAQIKNKTTNDSSLLAWGVALQSGEAGDTIEVGPLP